MFINHSDRRPQHYVCIIKMPSELLPVTIVKQILTLKIIKLQWKLYHFYKRVHKTGPILWYTINQCIQIKMTQKMRILTLMFLEMEQCFDHTPESLFPYFTI